MQQIDAAGRPVTTEPIAAQPVAAQQVEVRETTASAGLRIFQIATAIAGAVLFVIGLLAVFDVNFDLDLLDTSAVVAGYGFSAAAAIAAILLGGGILAAALADQDRGTTAFVGLVTLGVGIAGLIIDGQTDTGIQVDRDAASLFIIVGAVVFACSLVPWWSRRRVTTVVR